MTVTYKIPPTRTQSPPPSSGSEEWGEGQVCGQWQGHIPTPVQSGCVGVQGGRGGKGLASERQKATKHRGPGLASQGPGMWPMARPHTNPEEIHECWEPPQQVLIWCWQLALLLLGAHTRCQPLAQVPIGCYHWDLQFLCRKP